jgi:dipeptidyl aminopeptidase/acylaminoacyl peptidase
MLDGRPPQPDTVSRMYRILFTLAGCAVVALASGFQSSDFLKLRSVSSVQFSPDGARLAYLITRNDGPGRPFGPLWIMTLADGKSICLSVCHSRTGNRRRRRRPIVITRYLYKPTVAEGNSHFNDNKRLHIFVVDVAAGISRQLTSGVHYEHSIDWSPEGDRIYL